MAAPFLMPRPVSALGSAGGMDTFIVKDADGLSVGNSSVRLLDADEEVPVLAPTLNVK